MERLEVAFDYCALRIGSESIVCEHLNLVSLLVGY